ncbi:MAG: PLP-dependent transferase [Chloroflexi bacterium]|nr:PLP-dependent transferase [Chloroflexota bacterium]
MRLLRQPDTRGVGVKSCIHSLILHPASTSHRAISPEKRAAWGIGDGLLRLSVGIEDAEEIIADLEQALA